MSAVLRKAVMLVKTSYRDRVPKNKNTLSAEADKKAEVEIEEEEQGGDVDAQMQKETTLYDVISTVLSFSVGLMARSVNN